PARRVWIIGTDQPAATPSAAAGHPPTSRPTPPAAAETPRRAGVPVRTISVRPLPDPRSFRDRFVGPASTSSTRATDRRATERATRLPQPATATIPVHARTTTSLNRAPRRGS